MANLNEPGEGHTSSWLSVDSKNSEGYREDLTFFKTYGHNNEGLENSAQPLQGLSGSGAGPAPGNPEGYAAMPKDAAKEITMIYDIAPKKSDVWSEVVAEKDADLS